MSAAVHYHSNIPEIRTKMLETANLVLRRGAMAVKADAQRRCPVDTGNLKLSAYVEFPQQLTGLIAFGAHYAIFVEKGHVTSNGGTTPGVHFLQKAMESKVPLMLRAMKGLA